MTRHGAMYHDKLSYALPTIVAGTLITAWKKKETRCFAKNDEFKNLITITDLRLEFTLFNYRVNFRLFLQGLPWQTF